jgi:hypothetical protein
MYYPKPEYALCSAICSEEAFQLLTKYDRIPIFTHTRAL